MASKKYISILIAIIILVGGIWFSLTYQGNQPVQPYSADGGAPGSKPQDKSVPDNQLKGINLTLYNDNRDVKWELSAEGVKQYTDKGLIELVPLTIQVFDSQINNLLYSFSASKGIYLTVKGQLDIEGPILIKKDNLQLTAGNLKWQKNDDMITGTGGIILKSSFFTLTGDRFQTNSALSKLTVYGNQEGQAQFSWKERS